MPLKVYEAADFMPGSYSDSVPEMIQEAIFNSIDAVDRVVPGIREVMEVSNLKILYDPKNRHSVFKETHRGHQGAYYWPLHMMYFADSGIKKSNAHETAHMIDILAGPSKDEAEDKYGKKLVVPLSFYSFFPVGGRVSAETMQSLLGPSSNFIGSFLVKVIIDCKWAQNDPVIRDNILYKLEKATIEDSAFVDFLLERVAQLMEEYVYTIQKESDNLKPLGVGSESYFSQKKSKSVWWGTKWILEYQSDIHQFYQTMIKIIFDKQQKGYLEKRLREQFDEFKPHICGGIL